jgi:hypothetical protein
VLLPTGVVALVDETDWTRLVAQVRNGHCTPFLGAGACAGALPVGGDLSEQWAADYDYPFEDRKELPRVMQWAATTMADPVFIKQQLANALAGKEPPNFEDPVEPHRLLADLPLPLYLTTNYDGFMTMALQEAGRRPRRAICPWYLDAKLGGSVRFDNAAPTFPEPLVYHLHGSLSDPQSMVVTEDDYLEFLIRLAADRAAARQRIIPPVVLEAMATKPLLFLGYSLRDWTFQVLFRGLLRAVSPVQHRRHVSVQLPPLPATAHPLDRTRVEKNLAKHLGHYLNVSVYWGTAHEFCRELHARL